MTPMPTVRYGLTSGVVNNVIYAIGGQNSAYLCANEAYYPLNNSWIIMTSMPTPRYDITSSVVNNVIFVIGGWAGTSSVDGNRQKSRLGNPLVNELLIGLIDKNYWNVQQPVNDIPNGFGTYIQYPSMPEIVNILFLNAVNSVLGASLPTLAPTNFPRNDMFAVYMTGIKGLNMPNVKTVVPADLIRYNATIAARPARYQNPLGFIGGDPSGFPNGRRIGDDVIDITLQIMMGKLCTMNLGFCTPADANIGTVPLTDGSPSSAIRFESTFPYLQTPLPGAGGSHFKNRPPVRRR